MASQLWYSQGAAAQLEVLAENLDPSRVYDGHLTQMADHGAWPLRRPPPGTVPIPRPAFGKVS
jgi:hypothetical protein